MVSNSIIALRLLLVIKWKPADESKTACFSMSMQTTKKKGSTIGFMKRMLTLGSMQLQNPISIDPMLFKATFTPTVALLQTSDGGISMCASDFNLHASKGVLHSFMQLAWTLLPVHVCITKVIWLREIMVSLWRMNYQLPHSVNANQHANIQNIQCKNLKELFNEHDDHSALYRACIYKNCRDYSPSDSLSNIKDFVQVTSSEEIKFHYRKTRERISMRGSEIFV